VNASGGSGSSFDTRRERVEAEAARLVSLGLASDGNAAERPWGGA
jgi:hypothetical protein